MKAEALIYAGPQGVALIFLVFSWHVALLLASSGLGSIGKGLWNQAHKTLFLSAAARLMAAALASAVRERMVKGGSTGLVGSRMASASGRSPAEAASGAT